MQIITTVEKQKRRPGKRAHVVMAFSIHETEAEVVAVVETIVLILLIISLDYDLRVQTEGEASGQDMITVGRIAREPGWHCGLSIEKFIAREWRQ